MGVRIPIPRGWFPRLLLVGVLASAAPAGATVEPLERGDGAWRQRSSGHRGARAAQGPIAEAIDAYDQAVAAQPDDLEAHWKRVRARWFAGEYVREGGEAASTGFDPAVEASRMAFEATARRLGIDRETLGELSPEEMASRVPETLRHDVAGVYFWSAVACGAWGRQGGLLDLAREGVAGRLYRYARISHALEPGFESGGPQRLLARLHAKMPQVPFVTGWVDRSRAVPIAEEAYQQAPDHAGNQLLLAITLLDLAPERREQALRLLERVASLEPDGPDVVEDLSLREEARERLAQEGGSR